MLEPGTEASVVATSSVVSMGNSSQSHHHPHLTYIGLDRLQGGMR